MLRYKTYTPTDILDFGKNKGIKLSEVFKFQPSYIEWAIINIEHFRIDMKLFRKLPNPTPLHYYEDQYNPDRIKRFQDKSLIESITQGITGDSLNIYPEVGVNEIKIMILEDPTDAKKINYDFPKWIETCNDSKF